MQEAYNAELEGSFYLVMSFLVVFFFFLWFLSLLLVLCSVFYYYSMIKASKTCKKRVTYNTPKL